MAQVSKKQQIAKLAIERGWNAVGAAEWREVAAAFPGVAASTLQSALEAAGLVVEQPWRGVKQHTFDELAQSLLELASIYRSRPELSHFARSQVIQAKDLAKWASRSPRVDEDKRKAKAEMADWMLVWLDDPAMFAAWVQRRRAVRDAAPT